MVISEQEIPSLPSMCSPTLSLTELLGGGSVLFAAQLQHLVIKVMKVQLIIQPATCSEVVV